MTDIQNPAPMVRRQPRILIVEDEFFIAKYLQAELLAAGFAILGPVNSTAAAMSLLDTPLMIDAVVLDINLDGRPAFEIADALRRRGLPFIFATGYDAAVIPSRLERVPRIEKPWRDGAVAQAIAALLFHSDKPPIL